MLPPLGKLLVVVQRLHATAGATGMGWCQGVDSVSDTVRAVAESCVE
jgi:hypothetical protein